MFNNSLRTAFLTILVAAGWACSGVSDEARQQSAESVEHGLGYLRECDAQGRCNVPAAIVAWCRQEMANYKAPRFVEVVDEFPLNPSGKVLKYELRDRGAKLHPIG